MQSLPGLMAYRCRFDGDWTFESITDACLELTGYAPPDFLGHRYQFYAEMIVPGDRLPASEQRERAIAQRFPYNLEYCIRTCQGDLKWIWECGEAMFDGDGQATALVGWMVDISDRKYTEDFLQQSEAQYRGLFERAQEGIYQCSPSGQLLKVNPALAIIYGYSTPTVMITAINSGEKQPYLEPLRQGELIQCLERQGKVTGFESQVRRQDGRIIWISENVHGIKDKHGQLLFYEGWVEDVTERKLLQADLYQKAYYDGLTGLPNRTLFMEHLEAALGRSPAAQSNDRPLLFALLFLDVDRFKEVNDQYGHLVGDELLTLAAKRIQGCLRAHEMTARLAGDEFTILLEHLRHYQQAITAAERIQDRLRTPFRIQGHTIYISASIGITFRIVSDGSTHQDSQKQDDDPSATFILRNQLGEDPKIILQHADMALYQAKAMGGDCYQIFNRQMAQAEFAYLPHDTSDALKGNSTQP